MPNALSTIGQGSTCYVQVPTWSAASATEATGGWYIRRLFKTPSSLSSILHLVGASGSTAGSLRVLTDGMLRYRNNSADLIDSLPGAILPDTVYEVLLRRVYVPVAGIEMLLNGVFVGFTPTTMLGWLTSVNQLDRFGGSTYSTAETRAFEVFNGNSSYSAIWDDTTAPSTGTTWIGTVGSRSLTITNATGAANSWWVAYGGSTTIGSGVGSTTGVGFDISRLSTLTSSNQFTTGDSFDLSLIATTFAALNYSSGDAFAGDQTSALAASQSFTFGDGYDLPRVSASLLARNITAGDGFGYGQAQSGSVIIIGDGTGSTVGDGFGSSASGVALPAQAMPTYGIPASYVRAEVLAMIHVATVGDGSCLSNAAIGSADLNLGMFLEPTVNSQFSLNSGSYVLSYASAYTRANAREGFDLIHIEYRRTTVSLKPKSFEADNPWINRQFTTSESTNTRTRYLTL